MIRDDAAELEIFKNLFHSTAEEMGAALRRSAFSPNIKERRDYSCAVFDGQAPRRGHGRSHACASWLDAHVRGRRTRCPGAGAWRHCHVERSLRGWNALAGYHARYAGV